MFKRLGIVRAVLHVVKSFGICRVTPLERDAADASTHLNTLLLMDCSGSMNERDFRPSRLKAAKDAALKFLAERSDSSRPSSIGLVAFNDSAWPALPLTVVSKQSTIRIAIQTLRASRRTNLVRALFQAGVLFKQASITGDSEVVLLTDGLHNAEGDPACAADELKRKGCRIHTVGIGGSPETVDEKLLRKMASKDEWGNPLYRFIKDSESLVRHFGEIGGLTR